MQVTAKDEELIALLKENARAPVALLARKLKLSRTTVQDRLKRLEENGVIAGYSLKLSTEADKAGIRAFVTIEVEPRRTVDVGRALTRFSQIETLHTVSGKVDLIALVKTHSAEDMDDVLDAIGEIPGVTGTESAIILSTKLDRR